MTPVCLRWYLIILGGVSLANPHPRRGPDQTDEAPPLAPADVCDTSPVFRDSFEFSGWTLQNTRFRAGNVGWRGASQIGHRWVTSCKHSLVLVSDELQA